MKFRTRLLILLLIVTLLPLGLSFIFQRASTLYFGAKLADDTRSLLDSDATNLLHTLVDNYNRILKRDKAIALLTLQNQAQAVERRLSSPPPQHPQPIFFSEDYTTPQTAPDDLIETKRYQHIDKDGNLQPIPVSYSQQTVFLAKGTKRQQVETELHQLSTMPEVYRTLHDIQPNLFLWQYTALRSGVHTSYPGKGGYPADYDPRQRQWYRDAIFMGESTQHIMNDVTTGSLILTISKPIYDGDGQLAGVTALDIDYQQFFSDWKIPLEWGDNAVNMILVYHEDAPDPLKQLEILLSNQKRNRSSDWQQPVKREYLDITDPQLQVFQDDLINNRSAVRKIRYNGQVSLWAYGARNYDEPFPLVIIPHDQIISRAVNAETYVNQQVDHSLKIGAILTIIVVIATTLLAFIRSRKVTEPIMQLATTANQLAAGNFDARVEINTGDELEDLGHIFNRMGANLKERDKMKHSLDLAKEIQQQFLPSSAPEGFNFDMAAKSLYCDETGGDYFDFIPLNCPDRKLGIAVGDVSGHGIGAALVMATARGILHSLTDRYQSDLESLVQELNNYLYRGTASSNFMTLFYGIINPESQSLSWISAGHAPTFLYRNGQVEELGSSGIPLGIFADTTFEIDPDIIFSKGDILLIGTDGIWETQNNAGEMFGTKKIAELLACYAEDSADEIIEKFIFELNSFRDEAPQDDDITLMVVKAR
jgi:sigma-B regulation protein RsbU (phosphoserine phosphatase)